MIFVFKKKKGKKQKATLECRHKTFVYSKGIGGNVGEEEEGDCC